MPLLAVLLVTVGCTSPAVEPPGLEATPTATPSVSASPTPRVDGILEESDPALGVVLEGVPALTGDEADVYDTIAAYEKEYWRTMTTNSLSPGFEVLASPELQTVMERVATNNGNNGITVDGTYRVSISDVGLAGDGTATAVVCSDYLGATFADPDGTYTPAEVGFGERQRFVVTLRDAGPTWQLSTSGRDGTC